MPVKFSFYKNGIRQVKPTMDVDLPTAIEWIKTGRQKELIEQIRESENKAVQNELKQNLSYFTFSGTFNRRADDQLIKHSGIIVIDIDEHADCYALKEQLKNDPYIVVAFISPRDNGVKVLMHIDGNAHKPSFYAIEKYFKDVYNIEIDPSGKDVSRATYISYDPDIYVNEKAQKWTEVQLPEAEINYETGEIITKSENLEEMDGKTRKVYDRAVFVTEQIEQKQLNMVSPYERWVEVGLSLATFGEAGRELFIRISRFHEDYNEAGRLQRSYHGSDEKFTHLLKTGKFTSPAKFFTLAKELGIDTRKTKQQEPGIPDGVKADVIHWVAPDGCVMTDAQKEETINYGFMCWNNQYWVARWSDDHRRVSYQSISNYVIRPLFLIMSNTEPKRLYEMKNIHGHSAIVDMPAANMVSVQAFCSLIESKGNYLIEMSKSVFHKLKTKWYDETKNAEEIKVLGWHKDGFYAFSNGIFTDRKFRGIDEFGMIEKQFTDEEGHQFKKYYFIPANSDIYKDEEQEYENEKKFIYVNRKTSFKEWADLFTATHGLNGRIAMVYYVTALFRDYVYNRFRFFPHLFGFGPPGTGKSTLGWSISYMFGRERKPFILTAGTAPGFYRTFAQFRNAIQWFDEYSNAIDPKRIADLKGAYDGSGHIKGDFSAGGNSNKTVSTPINSACYISGQELPTADNALFKRCILLQFYKTDYTEEERARARQLREMEELSMSMITASLMVFRQKIEEEYHNHFDEVVKDIKAQVEKRYGNAEERIIQNMCVIVAMYRTLEHDLPWPFTYTELRESAIKIIYEQNKLISKSAETSQFWETVQYLYNVHQIQEGYDFCIRTGVHKMSLRVDRNETIDRVFPKPTDVLVLSLSKVHAMYMKALREQGEKKGMNKESLIHYLQNSKPYIGAVNKNNYGERSTSGYAFDYTMLEEMGIDLVKNMSKDDDVVDAAKAYTLPVDPLPPTTNEDAF
jgi:hypothetical protein